MGHGGLLPPSGNRESFEQGFRTGARLMLEIFLESKENPCNKHQKEIQ